MNVNDRKLKASQSVLSKALTELRDAKEENDRLKDDLVHCEVERKENCDEINRLKANNTELQKQNLHFESLFLMEQDKVLAVEAEVKKLQLEGHQWVRVEAYTHDVMKAIRRVNELEAELSKAADFSREVHERLEKAHDVLILCERWFDSSRVSHHRDCKLADECDCGVEGVKRKIKQALASPQQAEGKEKP